MNVNIPQGEENDRDDGNGKVVVRGGGADGWMGNMGVCGKQRGCGDRGGGIAIGKTGYRHGI